MNNLSNLHPPSNRLLSLLFTLLFLPRLLSGQTAVPLTAGSFNWDAIGENGCSSPNPLTIATTGGMDASGYAFNGASGWPGSLSYTLGGNNYALRPYTGTNALRVMPSTSATLTLASPANLANLHFLVTSTEGASTATYTVNFTDASSQTLMTATTPDWIIGGGTFISDATSTNDCDVKGGGHLFQASGNISPANYGKTVSSITVSRGAGGGRLYIFGASSCGAGPYFTACPNPISVSCPGPISYTANTSGATSVSYSFGGATSGSGSGTGSGSSFGFGLTIVTITATNSCGSQTCSFFVAVDDNTPPTAICQPAAVSLTQAGTASIPATAINNGSFDNCGGVTLSPTQFNFFCNYGSQTVTLTVTDLAGNTATCTATVEVSDPIGPVFEFCPDNITVNTAPGQCNARVCYSSPRTYDDNCPPLTPAGYTYFNQNGAGPNNTKYYYTSNTPPTDYATASAAARAAGGHLAVITSAAEQAHIPPGVRWLGGSDALVEGTFLWETCEPFGYTNWAAGEPNNQSGIEDHMLTWTAGFWNDGNIAGPYGSVLEIEGVRFVQTTGLAQNAVFPVGTTTNTFVATDAAGNTSSCQFTVTVVDNQPPTITSCPANIPCVEATSPAGAVVTYVNPTATDICDGAVPVFAVLPSGSTFAVGTNTVVATATDLQGNAASCSFTIQVCDRTPPVIHNTPSNIPCVEATSPAGAVVFYTNPTATDIVDGAVTVTCVPASGSVFAIGTTTVVCTAVDVHGNAASTSFTVQVCDTTPPVIIGTPSNIPCVAATSPAGAVVFYANPTATDIVDGSTAVSCVLPSGSTFSNGLNTVVCSSTDAHGNSASTSFTIYVDNIPPTAVCQNITVPLAGSSVTITPAQIDGGSSDNCSFTLSASPTAFNCSNVGPNTVVLTVTDMSGNTATCNATVNVVDNTLPVATCNDNVTVALSGASVTITAVEIDENSSDNCNFSLSVSPSAFDCSDVGPNTVTLTVTDASGNTATCFSVVTVVDNEAPVAVCPASIADVVLDGSGNGTLPANIGDGSSTDNCGAAETSPSASYGCNDVGSQTVTLTATDPSGNTSTVTCTFNVVDNEDPVAVCPASIADVVLDGNGNGTLPANIGDGSSTDNCGAAETSPSASFDCNDVGPQTVTLTATDPSGNTSTVTCTFNVVDNEFPTITCPGPITVDNEPGLCSAAVSYTVTASDNCAYTISQTGGIASGAQFPVGTTTNTWLVTDASGHTASCSFTVTVLKIGDPDLLYAYTVIGFDEVKMKKNTVQSGGVGVVNAGKKAKLEHGTLVTAANTFVKAPDLDLNGGSLVTTYYAGQVSAGLLPAFQPNAAPCNNNLNIPDNSSPVTLNLACYGNITVGKNVSVTFSGNTTVTVKDLKLKEGSSMGFAQSTNLRIDKKLDTDKYVSISNNGHEVWIFAEDHVKIDDGNNVTANIYCQKHIHVDKTPAGNPTYMNGLFIAEKVDSKDNVFWNWSPSYCPSAPPPPPSLVANLNVLTFYAERKGLNTKLQWFTRTGQTNDFFIVERSANELDWHPILKVDGEGPADELMVFNDLDLDPFSGDNFYRLRLVSKDGGELLSKTQKVAFPDGFLAVYPNPNGGDVLFTAMSEFAGQAAHVEISNVLGNVVETRDFVELPSAEIRWNIASFASGSYFISVKVSGKRTIVKRFVVQRL